MPFRQAVAVRVHPEPLDLAAARADRLARHHLAVGIEGDEDHLVGRLVGGNLEADRIVAEPCRGRRAHLAPDPPGIGREPRAAVRADQRLQQFVGPDLLLDAGEGGELHGKVRPFHRIERILMLDLGRQHLQEGFEVVRGKARPLTARGRLRRRSRCIRRTDLHLGRPPFRFPAARSQRPGRVSPGALRLVRARDISPRRLGKTGTERSFGLQARDHLTAADPPARRRPP